MKKTACMVLVCIAAMLSISAQAEVVTVVFSDRNLPAVESGTEFSTGWTVTKGSSRPSRDAVLKLASILKEHGYVSGSQGFSATIGKMVLIVNAGDEKKIVTAADLADYKDLSVASGVAAIKEAEEAARQGGKGGVRGPFDMDAGVMQQGSKLTGSGADGIIIGMLGGLIGGIVDAHALEKTDLQIPEGVAVLKGYYWSAGSDRKQSSAATVYILVASDKPENAETLFNAAIDRFAALAKTGYALPQNSAPVAQPQGTGLGNGENEPGTKLDATPLATAEIEHVASKGNDK